jgi:hypothetical protein
MTSPLNSIKKRVGSIVEQAPTLKMLDVILEMQAKGI